jgi:hypothetical protein
MSAGPGTNTATAAVDRLTPAVATAPPPHHHHPLTAQPCLPLAELCSSSLSAFAGRLPDSILLPASVPMCQPPCFGSVECD